MSLRRTLPLVALALGAACRSSAPAPTSTRAPAIDEAALDRAVSPCDDFYAFACGGWMARTQIPIDRSNWSIEDEAGERTLHQLRSICEADAAGKGTGDREAQKVGAYYAACMDEPSLESHGLADLAAEWARLDAIADAQGLAVALARLHHAGVDAAFAIGADQDARQATETILIVGQGGLTLPDRDYYLAETPEALLIRERYADHIRASLRGAKVGAVEGEAIARSIFAVETELAESHWSATDVRDSLRTYHRLDRDGLAALAPGFPWSRYLEALGHPEIQALSVTTPRSVERLGRLMSMPLPSWRGYLKWRVLDHLAAERALPKLLVEERFAFFSRSFTGAKELEPRWKFCVRAVDDALGEALGASYVARHFPEGHQRRARKVVTLIEKALRRDLEAAPWMDEATREKALEKLAAVQEKLGYPEHWRDYGALSIGKTYSANLAAAARFELLRQLAKIGLPLDRSEWSMTPPTLNAYYNPNLNEIVFPAGYLQPPLFNPDAPPAVLFGSLGSVIGHELSHGFDDDGRHFDAAGNLTDWWSERSATEFEARARCLTDQYSKYEEAGAALNGELTLGENIADLAGIKLALQAWRDAQDDRPIAGFTPEQQLFVGYAQGWCFKTTDVSARVMAGVDPHAPPRRRVNGPLSNLPEFARAFSCAEGRPMVRPPAERCEVW